MKGTIKIFIAILISAMLILSLNSSVFAVNTLISNIDEGVDLESVDSSGISETASNVISIIRVAAVIIGVVLIAVFGIKFMLGSAAEKSEYQKSFIPLIVGIVVVFGSTYIAELLFNTFG